MITPPSSIRVASCDVVLEFREDVCVDNVQCFGMYEPNERKIVLWSKMDNVMTIETFYHELVHCIYAMYSLCRKPKEEKIADVFGIAMTQIQRDNPDLFDWISELLDEL